MWYADALSYKKRGYAITGLVYQALPMGAVPVGHNSIIDLKDIPCKEVDMGETNAYHFSLKGKQKFLTLSDDVEFYKGKIRDMSDRTELLQEKADDLERVKRYAGAEQIDTIIRKVKEQERTEQQIRRYDRSYGTR